MSVRTVSELKTLRGQLAMWRNQGLRIAFVPTMGNLHAGHYSLVEQAKQHADKVVASIFVNPLQFGKNEDLASYPRTLAADQEGLAQAGCDLLFTPTVDDMYPNGIEQQTIVEVPNLGDRWCGASRPGHFRGVATVVTKLFNMVQPDVALFGEKDFQQVAVIRAMVRDLSLPVEVVSVPTKREVTGLAMSSRNGYLTLEEKAQAALLFNVLSDVKAAILAGERDYAKLEQTANQALAQGGFKPDYIAICDPHTLLPASPEQTQWVVLAAAYLGKARLIDNVYFSA